MQAFKGIHGLRKEKKMTDPIPAFQHSLRAIDLNKLEDPGQLKSSSSATWNSSAFSFYLLSAFQIVFTK